MGECAVICKQCRREIASPHEEWPGFGPGQNYCGVDFCCCQAGLPPIEVGDILIDRNFDLCTAQCVSYGYVANNIMTIWRYGAGGSPFQMKFLNIFRRTHG